MRPAAAPRFVHLRPPNFDALHTQSGDAQTPALRFQPTSGSLLFFAYAPSPGLQEHAACPVLAGNKSTLTQWHRLGVSPDMPWDSFEDWGRFRNPHSKARWKGPRYGDESGAVSGATSTSEL